MAFLAQKSNDYCGSLAIFTMTQSRGGKLLIFDFFYPVKINVSYMAFSLENTNMYPNTTMYLKSSVLD